MKVTKTQERQMVKEWQALCELIAESTTIIAAETPQQKSDHKDSILCVSDNENYSPFDLPKTHINAIAIVMGVIRLE